jgi:chromosome segregation ATPase
MMRIKKIFVRNFRKFLQPVTLADLNDGVCVIAGDNEEGKSTIVHAVRSAFHLKYSTQATQHIQPYNSSAMPEVAVDFDLNGTTYHLRKVFGKKGSAELRTDSNVFMGSEAEEKLHELCNTGTERKETSIWNVLWVEQGTTFGEIKLGDIGKRTLQSALERELGSIVGGTDGQDLLKSVNELYLKWFTATGRDAKHSEHKQAEEHLAQVDSLLADATKQYEELQALLEKLDATRSTLKAHEDGRVEETLSKSLEELHAKKMEIEKQLQAFEQAQQIERAEQAQHTAAAGAWRQRSQLAHEVDSATARLKNVEAKIAEATEAHKGASEKLHTFQQQKEQLDAAYETAVSECESAERLEQLRQLQSQIRELQDHIERALSAQKHCEEIKKEGEQIKADRAALEKVRQTERQHMQLDAQLQAVATRLELRPASGPAQSLLLTERTTLPLEGWGEIVVTPGGGDLDKLTATAQKAREAFEAALAAIGVTTVEEAEALERKRGELLLEYKSWQQEIQKHAPAGVSTLQEQLKLLEGKLCELSASIPDAERGGEQLSIFSLSESAERLAKVRAKRDTAKQAVNQCRTESERCEHAFRQADLQLQSLAVQQTAAKEEIARLTERLTADRAQATDDALFQAVQEAEMKLQQACKARMELQKVLKALNASAIDADIATAERKLADTRAEMQRLREAQSRLEGALQTLGKTGITEEVEKLRGNK